MAGVIESAVVCVRSFEFATLTSNEPVKQTKLSGRRVTIYVLLAAELNAIAVSGLPPPVAIHMIDV